MNTIPIRHNPLPRPQGELRLDLSWLDEGQAFPGLDDAEFEHDGSLDDIEFPRRVVPRPPLRGPSPTGELVDVLRGLGGSVAKLPIASPAVVLSAGGGLFAVRLAQQMHSVTVVHPERRVIAAASNEPLASGSSVVRTVRDGGPAAVRASRHPIRPGIRYRCAPLERTGLPSASFGLVIIEQGHLADLAGAVREARRLARPGAAVAVIGFLLPRVLAGPKPQERRIVAAINDMIVSFAREHLVHSFTADEWRLLRGYGDLDFPFEPRPDATVWHPDFGARVRAQAKWDLVDFVEHIHSWCGVRRIVAPSSIQQLHLWNFIHGLEIVWGGKKRRRDLRWKVALRVGFAA